MAAQSFDVIVVGAGVIGASAAFHLAQGGARRVLLLERARVGEGTTAQSSGILRSHYSVSENVQLARRSWPVFADFARYVDDPEASAGLVRCGYLIWAAPGPMLKPLDDALADQTAQGIEVQRLDAQQAKGLLPLARFDDAALIGHEPQAGYADAYLVASGFARAARRRGVTIMEGCAVQGLLRQASSIGSPAQPRVIGVDTDQGAFHAPVVVATQNIWSTQIERWTGMALPLRAERHRVLALQGPRDYTPAMPVFKDLASPGLLYGRSHGGRQMLVSEGTAGETLARPDTQPGDIALDFIAGIGTQVARRFPGFEDAAVASSWTGVYDVTPDWNPVLGPLPELPGLIVGYGFSGHGFKLSPMVGKLLAQAALGLPTEVSLAPYALSRFAAGALLSGRYGAGAVS